MEGVLFVVMPFGGVERPQIGVSTLKAHLMNNGVPCHIEYLNILFAEMVGYPTYNWITSSYNYEVFAGEWVFARYLFSDKQIDYNGYINNVLIKYGSFSSQMIHRIMAMVPKVGPFLENCLRSVAWEKYTIIGFTSTFEQNLASLALAKLVKARFPEKTVVMGGGNCAGPMGVQLHKSFPFLDAVFTGEADICFPEFVRQLTKASPDYDAVKGYVRRQGSASIETDCADLVHNLDSLPYPVYDDYFNQIKKNRIYPQLSTFLQIETSRGCWWGAKRHCTFCGLNRDELTYRQKSPERAFDEMVYLVSRYGTRFVSAVDNIISMGYFKTLLPKLKNRKLDIDLFYETKSNLNKDQIKLLRDAGVTMIQPGIEALSDNILKLMNKGVSALQNVQLLKWCRQYQVEPQWNLLYGFPGENMTDYQITLTLIDAMGHLPPPLGHGTLRLDRFSPYFDSPEQYGIRHISALKTYRHLYPFEDEVLFNLAYFFEYDFDGKEKRERWVRPVGLEIERWKSSFLNSRLQVLHQTADQLIVEDTRHNRVHSRYVFPQMEKSIIEYCDQIKTLSLILKHIQNNSNGSAPSKDWLVSFLEYMVRKRLMVRTGDRYLSVILMEQPANQMGIGGYGIK